MAVGRATTVPVEQVGAPSSAAEPTTVIAALPRTLMCGRRPPLCAAKHFLLGGHLTAQFAGGPAVVKLPCDVCGWWRGMVNCGSRCGGWAPTPQSFLLLGVGGLGGSALCTRLVFDGLVIPYGSSSFNSAIVIMLHLPGIVGVARVDCDQAPGHASDMAEARFCAAPLSGYLKRRAIFILIGPWLCILLPPF